MDGRSAAGRAGSVLLVAALAACGGGGSGGAPATAPAATATPAGAFSVTPSSLTFNDVAFGGATQTLTVALTAPAPAPGSASFVFGSGGAAAAGVVAAAAAAASGGIAVSAPVRVWFVTVADPAIVAPLPAGTNGFTTPLAAGAASLTLARYAAGSTSVSISDGLTTATVPVTTGPPCGRPDALALGTQVLVPAPGATGVRVATLTALYAVIATRFNAAVTVRARVLSPAGEAANVPLVAATLPPGVVAPSPVPLPGVTSGTYRGDLPASLNAGTAYRVQFVDDACQPPSIAGAFTT